MKQIKIFLSVAALAVAGAMMSGCAEELEALQPANKTVTMKTTVGLGQSAATRGAIDPANGTTTFTAGDRIAVIYQNASNETVKAVSEALTAADISADGENATFSVELTAPKASGTVRYVYPAAMAAATIAVDVATDASATVDNTALATQDGTLDNLANALDLALYDGTMTAEATLPTGVTLQNQLTILELKSIKDEGDNDITAEVNTLTVAVGIATTYTVSRTPAAGPIYVAMLPVATAEDITFTAEVDGIVYNKTATGKTLAKNKINPVNLSMASDFLATPLTIEALEAGAVVNFDIYTDAAANPVQYRTFGGTAWTAWANYTDNDPVTLTSIGDKVQFRGDNARYATDSNVTSNGSRFRFTADCLAYGNIMSLVDSEHFSTLTTLTSDCAFAFLFRDNSHLKLDDFKPLRLPATQLSKECYAKMFTSCTGLNTLPQLPATQLAESCYIDMFWQCSGLTAIPEDYLPATQLAKWCYWGMFEECSNLTTAPTLPAATLAENCYASMFKKCPKLNSVTCLATDISASNCLSYWLYNSGTADGCERKVYVDPSMLTVGTDNSAGQWCLATSGTDGKRWTLATNDYTHLTSTNIGHVLAADGNIYANATAATTAGTTAEAVIAYVGKVDKYFDKFLALALEDADPVKQRWREGSPGSYSYPAAAAVNTYAVSHPITIDGTTYDTYAFATSKPYDKVADNVEVSSAKRADNEDAADRVLVKGWRLPSVTDWRYIFDGLGRQKAGLTLTAKDNSGIYSSNATPTDPLGVKDGMYYYKDGDASSLLAAINAACGNTALQSSTYWSSSEYSDNSDNAWEYSFYDVEFWWVAKAGYVYVRAVFAY